MSMMSTSNESSKDHRRDSGTSAGGNKRASVLSFQTALSGAGGYASNEEVQASSVLRKPVRTSDFEELDDALPPKPWLSEPMEVNPSGKSSLSSSPDDRHLPGGWGGARTWNYGVDEPKPLPRSSSPSTAGISVSPAQIRTPLKSPQSPLVSLDDAGHPVSHARTSSGGDPRTSPYQSRSASPSGSSPLQEQRPLRASSMLRIETTKELQLSPGKSDALSPLSVQSTVLGETAPADAQTSKAAAAESIEDAMPAQQSGSPQSEQVREGPTPPRKGSPPTVPEKNEVGLSSPPLSDNVIPPPPPANVVSELGNIPAQMPADRLPVSDFRKKPLARMSVDGGVSTPDGDGGEEGLVQARKVEAEQKDVGSAVPVATATSSASPMMMATKVGPGVGAHAARNSGGEQASAPAFAALMRKPSSGAPVRSSLASPPTPVPADRSPSPSIDTPPREPSPPPEGEVEARAEWERAQMRQMADRAKKSADSSRKTTFRTQLKPLHLVAAEETKRAGKGSPARESPNQSRSAPMYESPVEELRDLLKEADGLEARRGSDGSPKITVASVGNATPSPQLNASNNKGGAGLSTQQLQRQLARDQRRSVSAVNMAMGQMGVSDIGGAYPVFSSPSTSATNVVGGNRQYSGLMPQRSLVPPFELQNRPDGLPSALIGPDGTRKNPNDPEVCLECMMRDEDMIDVHVLGASLWERESDREFEDAIRMETEEDARRERAKQSEGSNGTHGGTLENTTSNGGEGEPGSGKDVHSLPMHPRLTKIRVKRVAKGEPLTTDRLKFHTQMNPPASSHRWKTLQTFLAVQERYIAMEQRAKGTGPVVPPKTAQAEYDNRMVHTHSVDSKGSARLRVSSPTVLKVAEGGPLTVEEKAQKERDIVTAREARRRNNTSGPEMRRVGVETDAAEMRAKRLSGPPIPNDNSSGHQSIPRRSHAAIPNAFARAGSAQDLRVLSNTILPQKEMQLPSLDTLAPPNAPFRGPSSPSTPGGRMRTVSSQLSLAGSGSMVDMHLGMEDRKEHRISQAGFIPGTPLHSQSPSALNRAYYGFPGDGDADHTDDWSPSRQQDQSMSYGEYDDGYAAARTSPDLERKKKKSGFRGFFSKISGKEGTNGSETSRSMRQEDEGGMPSTRRLSLGPDEALNLPPPPGIGGLLSKARRSTSSLLTPSGRQSMDSTMMLGERNNVFNNSPLMTSQTSLELGPFGSGPLPPPRKDSRFTRAASPRPVSPEKEKSRLRTFSSGNLMGKKRAPISSTVPSPSSRSSSIMQNAVPLNYRSASNGSMPITQQQQQPYLDREAGDRSSVASRLSSRKDLPTLPAGMGGMHTRMSSRPESSYPVSPALSNPIQSDNTETSLQRQGGQSAPLTPSQYALAQQPRNPVMQRYHRSDGFLPGDMASEQRLQGQPGEGGNAPKRPPRSPHRDGLSGASSEQQADSMDSVIKSMNSVGQPLHIPPTLQKEQYYHAPEQTPRNGEGAAMHSLLAQQPQYEQEQYSTAGSSSPRQMPLTPTTGTARKSRLLKLPFGRKRESVATVKSNSTSLHETPSLKSRSSRGTFDDAIPLGAQQGSGSSLQPGLDSLRGWGDERQRMNSTSAWDDRGLPPRSHSAMGMLDAIPQAPSQPQQSGMRGFLPRLRTNSRAALRDVQED